MTAPNKFEALASNDALVDVSGALAALAVALTKIANDIRLLGCGPALGAGRAATARQRAGQLDHAGQGQSDAVRDADDGRRAGDRQSQAVTVGGMQGHLELNVFKPLIGAAVLRSIAPAGGREWQASPSAASMESSRQRRRISELVERSLMLVTALAPEIGYDNAAKIAKHAHAEGQTLKEAGLALGLVDEATFDRVVRPETMTGVSRSGKNA